MSNTVYIFYGVEIPKVWEHWPSAWGKDPLNIQYKNVDITVPNIGGEPIFRNDKAIVIEGFGLTLFRYPHDQEDIEFQNNLGIIGYPVAEFDTYHRNNSIFESYEKWKKDYSTVSNFDIEIQNICSITGVTFYKPTFIVCNANCKCC